MKGVVLCGGTGSRLLPMTRVTNKHLLPVYDRPMVYYPIQQLVHAGIREILVVTGGEYAGDFLRLLGNGSDFGLDHLDYTYQEGAGGIADALGLARHFAADEPLVVILGDNLFQDPLADALRAYEKAGSTGAMILLKEVEDPQRFGVAEFDGLAGLDGVAKLDGVAEFDGAAEVDGGEGPGRVSAESLGTITRIVEKPADPPSPFAVTGCYVFDRRVFEIIDGLEPSERGELEITDVNNRFIEWGEMRYRVLEGWWTDAGTVGSLYRASNLVAEAGENTVLRPSGDGAGRRPPRGGPPTP